MSMAATLLQRQQKTGVPAARPGPPACEGLVTAFRPEAPSLTANRPIARAIRNLCKGGGVQLTGIERVVRIAELW
jgi:hypothetical protein